MSIDKDAIEGVDIERISLGKVLSGIRRLSLGSVLWLLGGAFAALVVSFQVGQWWIENHRGERNIVVPPPSVLKIVDLPTPSSVGTDLLKDISVFDLRAWVPVQGADRNRRISPVNYINYLHLRKTKAVGKYIIHYGTGGYAIDLRCVTHSFVVYQRNASPQHLQGKEYAVEVDISHEQVDKEFLIVVEATYWNGFSNIESESASTYTDRDINSLGELALIVLFPETKPFTSYELLEGSSDTENVTPYRGVHAFYADSNKRFIYWSVRQREPDHHYKLQWGW